jgi:heme/copper-type cytochrome/quinol oxidase subunit 2
MLDAAFSSDTKKLARFYRENRKGMILEMNTPTIIAAVLILWLVMGLGFLAKYASTRNNGKTRLEAWFSYEGVLFILSVVVPLLILLHKSISG